MTRFICLLLAVGVAAAIGYSAIPSAHSANSDHPAQSKPLENTAPPPPLALAGAADLSSLLHVRTLTVFADTQGRFWTICFAADAAFRCLIATDMPAITFDRSTARQIGLDPEQLNFDDMVWTANGQVHAARARVARLSIGPFTLSNVPVTVLDSSMEAPLLGMELLRGLDLEAHGDTLTITEK